MPSTSFDTGNTTVSHAGDEGCNLFLRDLDPFLLQDADELHPVHWISSIHSATKVVPQMFDGVQIWRIRHPWEHMDVIIHQEIPCDASCVRPSSILLENAQVLLSFQC